MTPIETLALLCPNRPVELRIKDGAMHVARFDAHAKAASKVAQHPNATAIYVGLNPFKTGINGTGVTDDAIRRRTTLLLDFDPVRPTDTNATDDELNNAIQLAAKVKDYLSHSCGWPDPVEALSGNGMHLLYRIDLPNSPEATSTVKGILTYLGHNFDTAAVHVDQSVFNASRITKLYGTMARKGPHSAERPHRMSEIVHAPSPWQCVAERDLTKVAALVPKAEEKPKSPTTAKQLYNVDYVLSHFHVFGPGDIKDGLTDYKIRCPWFGEHSTQPEGPDGTILRVGGEGAISFTCQHSHCLHRKWQDVRDLCGIETEAYRNRLKDYITSQKRKDGPRVIVPNSQDNVLRALKNLGVTLSRDLFAQRSIVTIDNRTFPLEDDVLTGLWLRIDKQEHFRPDKGFFYDVAINEAHAHSFHPVCDYLNSVKWDGTPRIAGWLNTYGKAKDTPLNRAIAALVLIAAVRRVRKPGCKFDELPILIAKQGRNKSSGIAALCPRAEWFSDDMPLNVDSKQVIERTTGKWIVEAGELNGQGKKQIDHLKAFLSRQVDGPVRLAYARLPVEMPRQFVVVGSTNEHHFLKDRTGNRRFWPVHVQQFDVEGIRRDRDQLWAEAAHREAAGESIRLDKSLWGDATVEQEQHAMADPWEEVIAEALAAPDAEPVTGYHFGGEFRLPLEVVWTIVKVGEARRTERDGERVTAIMQKLGFEKKQAKGLLATDKDKSAKRWCRAAGQTTEEAPDA